MPRNLIQVISKHKALLVTLALALAVRLIYLADYSQTPVWEQLTVDNWYQHHWAESIAQGNLIGDTTYFRAPLYSLGLGSLYFLFGVSLWTARLYGLAIGLCSIMLTYLLARRILGERLAWGAAALQALYPAFLYFESELLLDPLFTLITQLAVHRFLIWTESHRRYDILAGGLLFGLAAITRPTILVAAPLIVIWVATRPARSSATPGSTGGQIGLFLAGLAICVLPVSIRNYAVAGDPVLISSQGGINLYIGNNDAADGLSASLPEPMGHNWSLRQARYIAETARGEKLKPGEISDYWRYRAVSWILSHPGRFVELFVRKLGYQFVDREISNNRQLGSHYASFGILRNNPLSFGVVLPLAILGLCRLWSRSEAARFIAGLLVLYTITIAWFFINSRFRLPLLPYYIVFAVAGVNWIISGVRQRSPRLIWHALIAVAAAWFAFDPPWSFPDRRSTQHLLSRGLYQYHQGNISGALETFRAASDQDPRFPETNLNLGACYFRLGLEDSAAACFEREIDFHPLRHKAYHNLASLHLVNGRIAAAISMVDKSLELAPYDATANIIKLRALAADSAVSLDSLWRAVEAAAVATDEDLVVLNRGAGMLARNGCNPIVGRCLVRAEQATPPPIETDDQAFHADFRHSRSVFNREKARTYYLLGYCAGQSGRFDEAIHQSQRAISLDPNLVEAYINLSSGYRSTGRIAEADSVLTVAAGRFPGHDQIRKLLPR